MSAKINYLSIQIKIGSQTLALETDDPQKEFYRLEKKGTDLKSVDDFKKEMKTALDGGFTLKMEKGKAINVTIGELKSWVNGTFTTEESLNLDNFLNTVVKTQTPPPPPPAGRIIDDISIQLWNLSIGYKKGEENDKINFSFTFYIKVTLKDGILGAIFPGSTGDNRKPIFNIV